MIQESTFNLQPSFWRTLKTAAWLGWQIESNWTDPFLFAIYSIVKPLSAAGILVIMYSIITQGNFASPLFSYIYLGNAFYSYVGAVMAGVSWAVIDDRERYKTLKYMYIAPIAMPSYLVGRGVARIIVGTISVFITIVFGMLFLQVQVDPLRIDLPLFLVSLIIGIIMLTMLGLILASVTLLVVNHSWFYGEAVAGALYLFSGAIFPLEVLPEWLRPVGFVIPMTYWLELIRRSLLGTGAQAFPTLAAFSNLQLLGILAALSIFFGTVAIFFFRWCDHLARERGMIDKVTNY